MSLHYHRDNSYLFISGIGIFIFERNNGSVIFPTQFCLGSISDKYNYVSAEEIYFKGNDFSVDYYTVDSSDILNMRKDLMVKNNIKKIMFELIKEMFIEKKVRITLQNVCH